mmetsp:Transcript_28621/g.32712  ORF Transcript_28621/g.32712 Transcript_28621/m.32712 type:complete len:322 (+) Transcript_28621:97-1062(+)
MNSFEEPWVEKYRPKYLKEVTGNRRTVQQLEAIAKTGNLPNIILSGPPGCGKTTSILCLAREILGEDLKAGVLELNASDDRGIDAVREKIKSFAQTKVNLKSGLHKIIVLDEADSMVEAAQQALRMIMTEYSSTTRFALACNDSSKIIEPIQSRCAMLRYTRVNDEEIVERILHIIKAENITYDPRGLEALTYTAEGDMRQAVNNLQSTVAGFDDLTYENVFKVCDQPNPKIMRDIITACTNGDFNTAQENLDHLSTQGYSPIDIVGSLTKECQNMPLSENLKLLYLKELALLKMRVLDGCASPLQLSGSLGILCEIKEKK